jgi:uncharacterized membrane protein AbrB (regulator of aidB expression)
MVVMAQEYGADVRLVALMQYLRVLFVVGAAALVVRYALGGEAQEMTQHIVWFPPLTLQLPTLLLTAVACWLGLRRASRPGPMLFPMLAARWCRGGLVMLELPNGCWRWPMRCWAGALGCSLIKRFFCWP